jgi:hypothetical protein
MKYEAGALTAHFNFHFHVREGELMQGRPEGGSREEGREGREGEKESEPL